MTKEKIINELISKGYKVEETTVVKNGIKFQGITIGNEAVRPNIYLEQFLERSDEELEDVVDTIINMYNQSMQNANEIAVSTKNLLNWDYAKNKLMLCIQPKGNEDIVKEDFLDLEKYVRVVVSLDNDDMGSFKVKPEHLKHYGISKETLFQVAWENTKSSFVIEDIAKVLEEMGMPVQDIDFTPMIVGTNKEKVNGAAIMLDIDTIGEVADRYENDLAILPSSIHEILIVPVKEGTKFSDLNVMIQNINNTQVAPEEILSNHAYRFNREDRCITYYYDTKSGKYPQN